MMIEFHTLDDCYGWQLKARFDSESDAWSKYDRVWVDHLAQHGGDYVRCGDSMYSIVHDRTTHASRSEAANILVPEF